METTKILLISIVIFIPLIIFAYFYAKHRAEKVKERYTFYCRQLDFFKVEVFKDRADRFRLRVKDGKDILTSSNQSEESERLAVKIEIRAAVSKLLKYNPELLDSKRTYNYLKDCNT